MASLSPHSFEQYFVSGLAAARVHPGPKHCRGFFSSLGISESNTFRGLLLFVFGFSTRRVAILRPDDA